MLFDGRKEKTNSSVREDAPESAGECKHSLSPPCKLACFLPAENEDPPRPAHSNAEVIYYEVISAAREP